MVMRKHGTQHKSGPINMCLIEFAGKYFIFGIGLLTMRNVQFCQFYVFICARLEKTKYHLRGNTDYIQFT